MASTSAFDMSAMRDMMQDVCDQSNAKASKPVLERLDGMNGRIGAIESKLEGFSEWQGKQEAVNEELMRRIEALEKGTCPQPRHRDRNSGTVLIKLMGEVAGTDKGIEAAVEQAVGSFASLGCTVVEHVHPRRSSKAAYSHMMKVEFGGAAEKAGFINRWTAFDPVTKKTRPNLKIGEVEVRISEPLPPAVQKMLTELIQKKDELAAAMGVDGATFSFDLRKGTITSAEGQLLYSSPEGQGN